MTRSRASCAVAAIAMLGAATPALAGSSGCHCALFPLAELFVAHPAPVAQPPVTVVHRTPRPLYVVNRGPVYEGPGVVIGQQYYTVGAAPRAYPYVSGHYPSGSYAYQGPAYGASPTLPAGTVVRARAEMRLVSPDRIDIQLYRED